MLNIGLMGAWHVHFKGYATAVAAREDCRITALWDPDAERGQKAADAFGCEYVADMAAFCAREDVDAVVVCTETDLHYDVITAAARAGKHIFTEKVLCFDRESALAVKKIVVATIWLLPMMKNSTKSMILNTILKTDALLMKLLI